MISSMRLSCRARNGIAAANDGFEKTNGIFENFVDDDVVVITIKTGSLVLRFPDAADDIVGLEHAEPSDRRFNS